MRCSKSWMKSFSAGVAVTSLILCACSTVVDNRKLTVG
jgi:hypothetical protein